MLNKDKILLYFDRAIIACLCLLIFCLPFAKAGVEIFVWSALFIWIVKRVLGYRTESFGGMFPETALNRALGVFIAVNALSGILSANLGLSLRGFFGKELKFLAIFFMLVEVVNSRERLRIVLMAIIASVVLIVVDAWAQYFGGTDFIRGYDWARLRVSFSTANDFSGWLIVVIPLLLGLPAIGKPRIGKALKVLSLVLAVVLFVCLLATYSRGAWLGFATGIFFTAWFVFKNLTLKIKTVCLSMGIGLVAIFLILPQPIKAKIGGIGRINFKFSETVNARIKSTLKTEEGSTPIRLNLWKEALQITRDHPLTGCGLNTYSMVARGYKSFDWGGVYPHNSYLQMAAETGLLGLFAFLWVLFTFFKTGMRHLNQKRDPLVLGLLSGIAAFLVQAFFDTNLYALQLVVLFWYMVGLTIAVIKLGPDISDP